VRVEMKKIAFFFSLILPLVSVAQPQLERFKARYDRAESLMEQGFYEQAIREFKGAMGEAQRYGFQGEVRSRVGECYFNLGKYLEAISEFEGILASTQPGYEYLKPEARYGVGTAYLMLGNFQLAEEYFRQITTQSDLARLGQGILKYRMAGIEEDPVVVPQLYQDALRQLEGLDQPIALLYSARAYTQLRRPLEAMAFLNRVVREQPNTRYEEFARFNMGDALFNYGDYGGARIKYQEFLTRYPQSVLNDYASYKLACCYLDQERYGEALDLFNHLTRHENRYLAAHALYFAGEVYSLQGRLDDALTQFQRVRANYPGTDLELYASYRLYETYRHRGMNEDAREAARHFAQMVREAGTREKFQGLGEFVGGYDKFEYGDYSGALADFQNIYEFYEKSPLREPAATMVLLCNNLLGRYTETVGWGRRYVEANPEYEKDLKDWRARLLFNLADGYYYSGDLVNAEHYYNEVKSRFPYSEVNALARSSLGWIYLHQNHPEQAYNEFKGLFQSQNTTAAVLALFGAGIANYNMAQYDSALSYFVFDEALYRKQGLICNFSAELVDDNLYYSGMCYSRLGYYANALDAWQRLITEYPASPKARDGALQLGGLYFQGGKYQDAITAFDWLIGHFPGSAEAEQAQLQKVQAYYNMGDYARARQEADNLVRATSSDTLLERAEGVKEMVYYRQALQASDPAAMAEAIAQLRAELPHSQYLPQLYYNLGECYSKAEDHQRALEAFQQVGAIADTGELVRSARLGIAEVYFKLKDWVRTIEEYGRFVDQYPEDEAVSGAIYYQGVAYYNLGRQYQEAGSAGWRDYIQQAMGLFKRIADNYPKSEFIEEARKNLETCEQLLR
jgi:tetratricopeptide (TPR) repeat protein